MPLPLPSKVIPEVFSPSGTDLGFLELESQSSRVCPKEWRELAGRKG